MGHGRRCPFAFLTELTCFSAKYFPVNIEILFSKFLILIALLPAKGQQAITCTSHDHPLSCAE